MTVNCTCLYAIIKCWPCMGMPDIRCCRVLTERWKSASIHFWKAQYYNTVRSLRWQHLTSALHCPSDYIYLTTKDLWCFSWQVFGTPPALGALPVYPGVDLCLMGQMSSRRPRRSMHSGDKDYKCNYPGCDKAYYSQANLIHHQVYKHGRERKSRTVIQPLLGQAELEQSPSQQSAQHGSSHQDLQQESPKGPLHKSSSQQKLQQDPAAPTWPKFHSATCFGMG